MKQRLKFHLIGLLLVLYSTAVMGANPPIRQQENESVLSYISQHQANQKAIYNLLYIYAHIPQEIIITFDSQYPSIKNSARSLLRIYDIRNSLQTYPPPNNHTQSYFHPDPVGYYIFALKKIVI